MCVPCLASRARVVSLESFRAYRAAEDRRAAELARLADGAAFLDRVRFAEGSDLDEGWAS
jgi:hypothetical protein